jgi:putative peptide zinc metalloprotease protein
VDTTAPASADLLERPVCLRPDIELLEGANGKPMLYIPVSESYVQLGRATVLMLPLLDGSRTGAEVARDMAARMHAPEAVIRPKVDALLDQLRQADVLLGLSPAPVGRRDRIARGVSSTPMKRLPLRSVVAPLRRFAGTPGGAWRARLGWAALLLCLACGVSSLLLAMVVPPPTQVSALLPAVVLLLLQIVSHEAAHGLVLTSLGVPPREAGLALWFYVLPVAYVDRTDAYRVRSRLGRFAIPAAGPMHDLTWLFGTAVVAVDGSPVASALFYLQVTLLLAGANPFLPTDGYQMLEAVLGETNMRGRAIGLVAYRLLGRPLPPHLVAMSGRRRLAYYGYGAACLAYLGSLLVAAYLWAKALGGMTATLF